MPSTSPRPPHTRPPDHQQSSSSAAQYMYISFSVKPLASAEAFSHLLPQPSAFLSQFFFLLCSVAAYGNVFRLHVTTTSCLKGGTLKYLVCFFCTTSKQKAKLVLNYSTSMKPTLYPNIIVPHLPHLHLIVVHYTIDQYVLQRLTHTAVENNPNVIQQQHKHCCIFTSTSRVSCWDLNLCPSPYTPLPSIHFPHHYYFILHTEIRT